MKKALTALSVLMICTSFIVSSIILSKTDKTNYSSTYEFGYEEGRNFILNKIGQSDLVTEGPLILDCPGETTTELKVIVFYNTSKPAYIHLIGDGQTLSYSTFNVTEYSW